ncbi:MAG: NHL repeat-containing protein [Phycisphaerales bacterium]|nr:NHL repeat-containing protein [Phycisphaerales bacterium]
MNMLSRRSFVLALAIGAASLAPISTARAGELLVCNFNGNSVTRYDLATGAYLGTLDPAANIQGPLCARLGPDGLLYVASEGNNRIVRFNPDTWTYKDTFVAGNGLTQPTGLTWDTNGDLLVSSFDGDSILKFDGTTGAPKGALVTSGQGTLNGPDNGIIVGPDGAIWVPSYWNNRVIRYNADTGATIGQFATVARPRVMEFRGGAMFITSETNNSVRKYDVATGQYLGNFVASGSGGLTTPIGMTFASDGVLYVTSSNNKVLKYDAATGASLGQFTSDHIDLPTFVTVVPSPAAASLVPVVLLATLRRRQ